ncbi:MAG TPA: hopanoid biosynthesis-associated protein HpnK [Methylomirabilota bacterium]|nr:hopanoid biosynthesis-associated protein HpnK [Methylomirabilota bacterium]
MGATSHPIRLIVNADDFGRSSSINQAVITAHRDGILTTASLMVTGEACAEAVSLARENPRLGVGLHITLACGRSALPAAEVSGLADAQGNFSEDPVQAGFKYWASSEARRQIAQELRAQFELFRKTGLNLDHVNGHLHFHLHPAVWDALRPLLKEYNVKAMRLTRDPLRPNLRLAKGNLAYRVSHALIFDLLSRRAKHFLDQQQIRYTDKVYGLLQNAKVDAPFINSLLRDIGPGNYELYSHPSLDEFKHEFDGLVSSAVREIVASRRIQLIRYSDL